MKQLRPFLALLIAASLAAMTQAQTIIVRGGHRHQTSPVVGQALSALQQDLILAISDMKAALPIYDGNRVRSIHAAHQTLLIVDRAISGAKAPARQRPDVNDKVGSAHAKEKYSVQQLFTSQTTMRQGLKALQQAWKDMQVAEGSTPNKQGLKASADLQKAITEANTAIGLHANLG